jgi:hypothetical protein
MWRLKLISKPIKCWHHEKTTQFVCTWLGWDQQSSLLTSDELIQDGVTGGHQCHLHTHIIWLQPLVKMVPQSSLLFFHPVAQWSIKAGGSIGSAIHATVSFLRSNHLFVLVKNSMKQWFENKIYNALTKVGNDVATNVWELVWNFCLPYYKSFPVNKEERKISSPYLHLNESPFHPIIYTLQSKNLKTLISSELLYARTCKQLIGFSQIWEKETCETFLNFIIYLVKTC